MTSLTRSPWVLANSAASREPGVSASIHHGRCFPVRNRDTSRSSRGSISSRAQFSFGSSVDALSQDRGWLEDHDSPRRNGCRPPGLRVATHALRFLGHDKGAERGELDCFAAFKTSGELLDDSL